MKGITKFALTLAAAGGVCYLFRDKIKASKAYQTVESNDKVQRAKEAATDTYQRVKESEPVQKAKETVKDTYQKVKESDAVQKAKDTVMDTYQKVKESDTVQKAKDTVKDTYDQIKDKVKDKMDCSDDSSREYFTLNEQDGSTAADVASSDVFDEDAAKAVTDAVAQSEDVIAEATDAVLNVADSEQSDVLGNEYMGLSDVSEDPSVLADQDKLDV